MVLIFLTTCIIFLYSRIFLRYNRLWKSIKISNKKYDNSNFISVIISCKNEEKNIVNLIQDLKNQDFDNKKLEIIIINDHSSDQTLSTLNKFSQTYRCLTVLDMDIEEHGKIMAISKGVKMAKGDIILCTDADCSLPSGWISTIVCYFQDKNINFISAPIKYPNEKTYFKKFQLLELISLTASGGASICDGKPIFCSGANIAFRKEIYENISEDDFKKFINDDVSLLNYIHKNYKGSISFIKDIRATITTQLHETYRSFIKQKIRWINFAKYEKNIYSFYISLVVFLMNSFLILHFFLFLLSFLYNNQDVLYSLDIYIFLFIFLSKFIVDYIFISSILKSLRLESLSIYIFPFQIIFAFYVLLIVPLSYIIKPEWKNNPLF